MLLSYPMEVPQWVNEPQAAELLAVSKSTLRSMRRDGRLEPGSHYLFSTGVLNGPVVYDISAIRQALAERTIAAVRERTAKRAATAKKRRATIESYSEVQA